MCGASAWIGTEELGKGKELGNSLAGNVLQVGPMTTGNLPRVLLGRAWVHPPLVAERNHAYREAITIAIEIRQNLMDDIPEPLRKKLAEFIGKVMGGDREISASLVSAIDQLLGEDRLSATGLHSVSVSAAPRELCTPPQTFYTDRRALIATKENVT